MSRKKTIELPPIISSFEVDGEIIALEIPHPDHKEIGKGSHQKNLVEAKLQKLVDDIYLDFFTPEGIVKPTTEKNNYLDSGHKFAKHAEELGYGGLDGADNSALRKTYYPIIKALFDEFKRVLNNRK
jgi:hypothetical protein